MSTELLKTCCGFK